MQRIGLVLMLLSGTALAAPKVTVSVTRVSDPDGKLDAATVAKQLPSIATCGTPLLAPAAITLDVSAGAVTDVRIPGSHGRRFVQCATRVLKAMKLESTATGVVIAISVDRVPTANSPTLAVLTTKQDKPPMFDSAVRPPAEPTTLTQADVDLVMRTSAPKFRQCYLALLKKQPDLAGKFVYSIEVAGGRVTHARAFKPSKESTALDRCMVVEIKKLAFPSRPVKTITYPFVFATQP